MRYSLWWSIPINFKNVDKAVQTDTEYVIPNKCKYMIIYTNLQPTYLTQRTPSEVGLTANTMSYTRMPIQRVELQEFIRGLGYQGLQVDGMTQSNAWAALGGIGEHAREAMNIVSPFYGAMYRGVQRMLTDLPLAPTKPIDAGVAKFCLSCKKCAENCPSGAITKGEQSYTSNNISNIQGVYKWQNDMEKCFRFWMENGTDCSSCIAHCPMTPQPANAITV